MSDKGEFQAGTPEEGGLNTSERAAPQLTGSQAGTPVDSTPDTPHEPAQAGEPQRGRPAIRLTVVQIALLLSLGVATVLLTWRTKALEKLIATRTPVSELVQKPAPGFTLTSLSGQKVSLSDYKGKKVVLSFWASWCGPCRVELPELRNFYQTYHKSDSNFEVLAISIDEKRSDAERYATDEKLPFPVLLDSDQKVAETYLVEGIPTTFVIDKEAKVRYANSGLDETMQFRLMSELDIKFPGSEKDGTNQQ